MIFQGYLGLAVLMVSYLQGLHVLQPILGKENVYSNMASKTEHAQLSWYALARLSSLWRQLGTIWFLSDEELHEM